LFSHRHSHPINVLLALTATFPHLKQPGSRSNFGHRSSSPYPFPITSLCPPTFSMLLRSHLRTPNRSLHRQHEMGLATVKSSLTRQQSKPGPLSLDSSSPPEITQWNRTLPVRYTKKRRCRSKQLRVACLIHTARLSQSSCISKKCRIHRKPDGATRQRFHRIRKPAREKPTQDKAVEKGALERNRRCSWRPDVYLKLAREETRLACKSEFPDWTIPDPPQ
jgi:hypothetical protein